MVSKEEGYKSTRMCKIVSSNYKLYENVSEFTPEMNEVFTYVPATVNQAAFPPS